MTSFCPPLSEILKEIGKEFFSSLFLLKECKAGGSDWFSADTQSYFYHKVS